MLIINLISFKCGACEKKKSARQFRLRERSRVYNKTCKKCAAYHADKMHHYEKRPGCNWRDRHKQRVRALRSKILAHYGSICRCCGESDKRFLVIDHTNGGGNEHRREHGIEGSTSFYFWIRRNGFPSGFQVLCHNCNYAKSDGATCPHQSYATPLDLVAGAAQAFQEIANRL